MKLERRVKILIISHALIQVASQARWRELVQSYSNIKVRILVPEYWVSNWFTTKVKYEAQAEFGEFYDVVPVKTTNHKDWTTYLIKHLSNQFREYKPDIIYCIHEEDILQLQQTILYKNLFCPKAKLIYFSMNLFPRVGKPNKKSLKKFLIYFYKCIVWRRIKKNTDGIVVHYPAIEHQIRSEGYSKPALIQTQIGVDTNIFYPDETQRREVRKELGLNGFVIGFAGRLVEEKGVIDLINACDNIPDDWQLLLIGDGPCRSRIEQWASHSKNKVYLTGFVDIDNVAKYMRAMDVFFLGSHNIPSWIDTFPLVVAQSMATAIPTIVSDCGALPYQVGKSELIFEAGNCAEIRNLLEKIYVDESFRLREGQRLFERAKKMFSVDALTKQFMDFIFSITKNSG